MRCPELKDRQAMKRFGLVSAAVFVAFMLAGAPALADGASAGGQSAVQGTPTDAPAAVPTTATAASEIALLKAIVNTANNPATIANQPVGATNFAPAQVSVGTTATQIVAARPGAIGTGRISVTITNTTTTPIFLGGSGVTLTTGALLPGIVGASKTISTTAAIFGIAGSAATVTEDETF
jgi:hypothetical protein